MGLNLPAINLTMGKNVFPYQDVMSVSPAQTRFAFVARENRCPLFRIAHYNIPSIRGSHSEISGT